MTTKQLIKKLSDISRSRGLTEQTAELVSIVEKLPVPTQSDISRLDNQRKEMETLFYKISANDISKMRSELSEFYDQAEINSLTLGELLLVYENKNNETRVRL
jgi:tRNA threonylcarbamoyladenosine modification (KEOPS) complex  Pcc1 subunit